jgi:valyl-tRNA synthetase
MDSKLFDSLLESSGRLKQAALEDARGMASFDARERVLAELRQRRESLKNLIRVLDEESRVEEVAGRAARASSRYRCRGLSCCSQSRAA